MQTPWEYRYAHRTQKMGSSVIRELLKLTEQPDIISFGGGLQGLMVPVVKNAADKSILQLAEELTQLTEKARNRTIDLADLKGGTFTITNYGALGGIYGTPIINHPEVANLGTGKIKDTPVVRDGKVEIRKILFLALSFDHRVVDGAEAARFLNTVIARLEDPDLILLES